MPNNNPHITTELHPSIVIEVVDDIGENKTNPHEISNSFPGPRRLEVRPLSTRTIDHEPTHLDVGLPRSLADELCREHVVYDPLTSEIASNRLPIFLSIIGGCCMAIFAALLLLYVAGK